MKWLKVDSAAAVESSDAEDRDKSISQDEGAEKKKKKHVGFRDRKVSHMLCLTV